MRIIAAFSLLTACNIEDPDGQGGQQGEINGPGCVQVGEESIPPDFVVAELGFAPSDVTVWLEDQMAAEMVYLDSGQQTVLDVIAQPSTTAWLVDYEYDEGDGGTGTAMGAVCEDQIDIEGTLTLQSQDGSLDEVLDGRFVARSDDAATFRLQPVTLNGSFAVTSMDPAEYDVFELGIDATLRPEEPVGELYAWTEKSEDGPDGTASAGRTTLIEWSAELF